MVSSLRHPMSNCSSLDRFHKVKHPSAHPIHQGRLKPSLRSYLISWWASRQNFSITKSSQKQYGSHRHAICRSWALHRAAITRIYRIWSLYGHTMQPSPNWNDQTFLEVHILIPTRGIRTYPHHDETISRTICLTFKYNMHDTAIQCWLVHYQAAQTHYHAAIPITGWITRHNATRVQHTLKGWQRNDTLHSIAMIKKTSSSG